MSYENTFSFVRYGEFIMSYVLGFLHVLTQGKTLYTYDRKFLEHSNSSENCDNRT